MRIDIVTIFPGIFKGFLSEALIARAQKKKILEIAVHDLRRWTSDPHRTVDGRPYGGGVGMVMMVEPLLNAIRDLRKRGKKTYVIVFSPAGKKFDQVRAKRYAKYEQIIMICGRYEGVDDRVAQYLADEEISIGDYVLFGGEVPAMTVVEAVARLLPGAVGKQKSVEDDSFKGVKGIMKAQLKNLLEYPHYTRPEKIKIGKKFAAVPKILLTGDHKKVEEWRNEQALKRTRQRRPDLIRRK